MPASMLATLKGVLFLLLFLIDLSLFLLLLLLFVPPYYRGSGVREEEQLSGCFSVSQLLSPLRFGLSYAAEKETELFVLGFRIYHSDETKDTADAAEENDFNYPESMASKDFESDTAETAVVEQQRAITKQTGISSGHLEVTEPASNGKGVPPQREDERHRSIPEGKQRAMRCRGRNRRHFRKQ